MILDIISDTHGSYPELPGGDLLIVAGDLTARDTADEQGHFIKWLWNQKYRKRVFIAGNHDQYIQRRDDLYIDGCDTEGEMVYLCDSGTEFEGLKIWGSPWTLKFPGMNPYCMAFTVDTEEELAEKFALIPDDTDILVTHSPPFGMLDKTIDGIYAGSKSLADRLLELKNLRLHCYGHIHEAYGTCHQAYRTNDPFDENPIALGHLSVNASHVNERYDPVNAPVRIEI